MKAYKIEQYHTTDYGATEFKRKLVAEYYFSSPEAIIKKEWGAFKDLTLNQLKDDIMSCSAKYINAIPEPVKIKKDEYINNELIIKEIDIEE